MLKVKVNGKYLNIKICTSHFSRAVGLMFAPKDLEGAFFEFDTPGTYPIHSLFVPKRFHAFYLDSNLNVVDSILNISPWKLYIGHKGKAKYLLELFSDLGVDRIKKVEITTR